MLLTGFFVPRVCPCSWYALQDALQELENIGDDTPIYKSVGSLYIKADNKEIVGKDLKEQQEIIGVRVKTLERQEKQLKDRYQSLQKEITEAVQRMEGIKGPIGSGG